MKTIKLNYLIFVILAGFLIGFFAKAENSDVITVSGNKFLLNGSPIVLSGVAMGDPHDRMVNYKRSSFEDYKTVKKDWQANVVRLSVHPGVFLNDWVKGRKILEDEVAAARGLGLIVVIDWHVIGEPDGWYKSYTNGTNKYYIYNSDFSLAKSFWQYAAEQFKADRGIIFELWNEPVDEHNDLSWNKLKPYWTELVQIIRNAGSQNVVLAAGVFWAYDLRGIKADPLAGENIAYAWHVYNNNGISISREAALDGLNQIYPVFITEWGSNNDKDFGFSITAGQNVYNYLESVKNLIISQNLSQTAWCWHPSWKPTMFNAGWVSLNSYGNLVKDFLNYPEKVSERLKEDERIRQALSGAISSEFRLRLESYLKNGADANSVKLGAKARQEILASFVLAYGHKPGEENEWQDLMRINNGYWPSKISQAAEDKAKADFKILFKRAPDMNNNADKHAIKLLAYDIRQRMSERSLAKEKTAIANFKKIFKRLPVSSMDWKFIRAFAYGGVKK